MNKRFLCRGKRLDTGDWVYGYYYKSKEGIDHILIAEPDDIWVSLKVDPKTVTMSTGIEDTDGNLIFEGDVVKAPTFSGGHYLLAVVTWDNEDARFSINKVKKHKVDSMLFFITHNRKKCFKVGNIYDNKDLIEAVQTGQKKIIDEAIKQLKKILAAHRGKSFIACEESCFCWDIEKQILEHEKAS
jgi:uncharacterized phage protein (TIGR01671 family)